MELQVQRELGKDLMLDVGCIGTRGLDIVSLQLNQSVPGPCAQTTRYPSYALNPFLITERRATDFRFEAFNAFNRANFNNPNATIGTSSAGVISGTGPARILQASLKVIF